MNDWLDRQLQRWLPWAQAWHALLRSFGLHVLTGFVAVGGHYLSMAGLLHAGAPHLWASGLGFCVGATLRYLLSYHAVFSPQNGVRTTLTRFLTVLGLQLLANLALLESLIQLGLPLWWAQIFTTILLTFANFAAYRWWVFR